MILPSWPGINPARAENDASAVGLEPAMRRPIEVANGVYVLGNKLVNWYLVEEDGRLTAVDAGLRNFSESLEADLGAIGYSLGDVEAVVLTHSDGDHTGVARVLRDAGARVLIHSAEEEALRNARLKTGNAGAALILAELLLQPRTWRNVGRMARDGAPGPPRVRGAETFADGDVLDVPGRPRVVHMPGHTDGHCALLFERRGLLFTGDALCTWNFVSGRVGPQLMPKRMNVSDSQARESLAAIEHLDARLLLPGHGEPWHGSPAVAVARALAA